MVLIKWIEILHSITNVDILKCVPRFLKKLLVIIDTKSKTANFKKYFLNPVPNTFTIVM